MTGIERRKHKRFPFREDALIDGVMMFKCIDISEGGLYVYTGRSFEKNKIAQVTLRFKDKEFTVKAQVRHSEQGIGMGLQFIELTDEQREVINRLLEYAKSGQQSEKEKTKVLLIEDNDRTRQINKSKLYGEGFSVIEAGDGMEALKLLEECSPDLIILDLFMDKIDGFKVLSILKIHPKWKDIPVIVFSAGGTQDEIQKAIDAGADAFLSKMMTTPAKLAETVKTILNRRRKEE